MYRLVVDLAHPVFLLGLLVVLATANLWRKRRETRRRLLLLTVPLALFAVWCMPVVSYLALGSLEWQYPHLEERPDDAEAIVVLGGYVRLEDDEGKRFKVGGDSRRRCERAAEVYRQGKPLPVVVSGGKVDPDAPGPAVAVAMRDFLLLPGQDVPASDLIVEDRSRTTYENAVETCRLLGERGIRKIILVTDADSLHRATACFRKQGCEVVPCGCGYHPRLQWSASAFLPDLGAAAGSQEAFHEWLGITWYRLRGWL
jgi:uncharacterized SAM-binding protein YcdF (DUF218 family)